MIDSFLLDGDYLSVRLVISSSDSKGFSLGICEIAVLAFDCSGVVTLELWKDFFMLFAFEKILCLFFESSSLASIAHWIFYSTLTAIGVK